MPLGLATAPGGCRKLLARASGWQLERALIAAGIDPLRIFDDAITELEYDALTAPWLANAADALAMTVTTSCALLDVHAVVLDGSLSRRLLSPARAGARRARGIRASASRCRAGSNSAASAATRAPSAARCCRCTRSFFPDKDIFSNKTHDRRSAPMRATPPAPGADHPRLSPLRRVAPWRDALTP